MKSFSDRFENRFGLGFCAAAVMDLRRPKRNLWNRGTIKKCGIQTNVLEIGAVKHPQREREI